MDAAECNQSTSYNSIKQDLKTILKLVNAYVKVHIIKNCFYIGFVHSIDPISHSIILSVLEEGTYKTVVIPGHAVLDVKQEELPGDIKPPLRKQGQTHSTDDILKRKTRLISWLKTNLLPVTELENKIIIGNVTLISPYTISDLCTDNPIVAMQIKIVIEKMPEEYEHN